MREKIYIKLEDLEVYQLARELSQIGWGIYRKLNWDGKKAGGDQFIDSTDSVGANVAEGYGRFHYLDKIKFYYNARASLVESANHWLELLHERGFVPEEEYKEFKANAEKLSLKLNNFIKTTYNSKNNKSL